MYKISEFSKITNLTVKALRYYDEQGILKPVCRAGNAYRYYDENDFRKAQLIVFLRDLDFSIAEIKDVFAHYDTEENLSYFLAEKKIRIAQRITGDRELMEKIDRFLAFKKEEYDMDYKIEIKETGPMEVASIRFMGTYKDVGKYLGTIYKEVKNKAFGAPFSCYYDTTSIKEICIFQWKKSGHPAGLSR